jgi:hypothetical protein
LIDETARHIEVAIDGSSPRIRAMSIWLSSTAGRSLSGRIRKLSLAIVITEKWEKLEVWVVESSIYTGVTPVSTTDPEELAGRDWITRLRAGHSI